MMNFHFAVLFLVASCHAQKKMIIDKITIKNHCKDSVYFGQSMPQNAEIKAGGEYTGDWQIGGSNVAGRLAFSFESDLFPKGVSGDATNAVWIEVASGNVRPGQPVDQGSFNFANQVGFMDFDLEVTAFNASNELVCNDGKARTALDPTECKNLHDASGEFKQVNGRPFCSFLYGGDNVKCATSEQGKKACTSGYASYISDHSMLWKPDGHSATSGNWLAQPRSTGRSSGEKGFPQYNAMYADGFVGRPTLNGRVGCGMNEDGARAVNFECFESCCIPHVVGLPDADRKEQCEAVGGVTAGTQGFVACEGEKGDVHIANLEIVTCPARADLSSGNVKMPSCPGSTQELQNPETWSPSISGQMKNGLGSTTSVSPSSADQNGSTSTTTSVSSTTDTDGSTEENSSVDENGSTSTTTSVSSTTDTDGSTEENSSVDENGSTSTTTSVSSTTDADSLTDEHDSIDQNDVTSTTTASSTDGSTDGLVNTTTASAEDYGSSSNRDSNGYTLHI